MSAPALQLAPDVADPSEPGHPGGDPVDRPAADAEACLLSALMQLREREQIAVILANVVPADFDDAVHGALYRIVAGMLGRGLPADFPMVAHEIDARPDTDAHHRVPLRRRLVRIVDATAYPERGAHYAKAVVAQSLRRSTAIAGNALTEAAAGAIATDDLYAYMCELGRAQRDHHHRYATLSTATGRGQDR
ncbi:DnaB-like helicase N-terminal domain-containing protein [Rhodococcus rhodnii]|uniref:DnaB-like helicase N-terminal domain-containing protein n=1 Tax=Rhodococcus rhodnii TaxID=38312 RepID=UPI00147276B5|nr:DnaB-like helicase N-terminal domain-containing protein [Rhodococcus rhodnii]